MLVRRAYKTELDPNDKQRTLLAKHAGTARFAWNWGLARRIDEYKTTGKSSNAIEQHRQLNELKLTDLSWMYEVSKCAPQEALRDLDKAFRNFFEKRTKHPRFKSKRRGLGGFRLTGSITVEAGRIKLPRLGWLRLKESGYLPTDAKINSVTVKERAGRWFVSIQVEEDIVVPENQGAVIGLDLGLSSLVVGSDGSSLPPPKPLVRSLKRLRRLSRCHARKRKGSANRRKSARRLARLHYRVACRRTDYLHKATTRLARGKSVIVVESLNVSGMLQNRSLARSISDAGWSELLRQLGYKVTWYGSRLVEAGRFYPSTKTCSACGLVKDAMPLSERVYRCAGCGMEINRDLNAARNLEKLATASSVGSGLRPNACGDGPSGLSARQEPGISATW